MLKLNTMSKFKKYRFIEIKYRHILKKKKGIIKVIDINRFIWKLRIFLGIKLGERTFKVI